MIGLADNAHLEGCNWEARSGDGSWVLDLVFRDDESCVRNGHAAENLAVVRHIALNLLRRGTTAKVGIAMKRPMDGWDTACLLTVLGI